MQDLCKECGGSGCDKCGGTGWVGMRGSSSQSVAEISNKKVPFL